MIQNKRAVRRHHRERQKSKRLKHFTFLNFNLSESEIMAMLPILIDTPKTCSCFMCGNPRKYFNEKTYQERKLNWTYKDA